MIAAILTIVTLLLTSLAYVAPKLPRLALTPMERVGACQLLSRNTECVGCGRFVHFAGRAKPALVPPGGSLHYDYSLQQRYSTMQEEVPEKKGGREEGNNGDGPLPIY